MSEGSLYVPSTGGVTTDSENEHLPRTATGTKGYRGTGVPRS